MKFLIILNAGLKSESFFDKDNWLLNCAKELDIVYDIKFNNEINYFYSQDGIKIDLPKYDAVLFYSKDIFLADALEKNGYKVFNSSDAIKICDNKIMTYKALSENNIKIPKTYTIPLVFYYKKELLNKFIETIEKELSFPLVAKKWYGSEGKQVFLINNKEELIELINKEKGSELLFQEYFEECKGVDIRLNVVNSKVVATIKRISTSGDFRSNTSIGGIAQNYTPTEEEQNLAIKASKAVKCDFCGVDILQTKNGPVVCEVNSNSQLINLYYHNKVNVAECILKFIKDKISQ